MLNHEEQQKGCSEQEGLVAQYERVVDVRSIELNVAQQRIAD
jgi:hypothetical protein